MPNRLFELLTGALARLPAAVAYALADTLGLLHYVCFPARRRAATANLAVMLPAQSRATRRSVVRAMMRSYTRMLVEFFRLPALTPAQLAAEIDVLGLEHVGNALARGHGAIVTSCHIGNWELGAVALASHGYRVNAVAGVQFGRWLATEVRDAKERLAVATIAPEDGFRKIFRALARNEIVALMVDGDVYSAGVECPFFGRATSWPSGPGSLAARTGAPVVAGYCERTDAGRFRIRFEPALEPGTFADAHAINVAIAAITERHIRDHIEQWCIFRPFWPGGDHPDTSAEAATARVRA